MWSILNWDNFLKNTLFLRPKRIQNWTVYKILFLDKSFYEIQKVQFSNKIQIERNENTYYTLVELNFPRNSKYHNYYEDSKAWIVEINEI